MENKNIGLLLAAFVMIIVGASIIGIIADGTQDVTTTTAVASEVHNVLPTYATGRNNTHINPAIVYTLTNVPTWGSDCPITNFVLKNSTGDSFIVTTDYIVSVNAGTYTLVNSATAITTLPLANNNTYANYNYCPSGYITEGWGRTVLNLVPGFFALALMAIGVGLFYGVMKSEGLLGL